MDLSDPRYRAKVNLLIAHEQEGRLHINHLLPVGNAGEYTASYHTRVSTRLEWAPCCGVYHSLDYALESLLRVACHSLT